MGADGAAPLAVPVRHAHIFIILGGAIEILFMSLEQSFQIHFFILDV